MSEKIQYHLIFTKLGLLRYISHLDLLRLFQRVVRRADLPIVFSKGYHPLPQIKMGEALKLGIESKNEEMKLIFKEEMFPGELKKRLNEELPSEIQIVHVSKK